MGNLHGKKSLTPASEKVIGKETKLTYNPSSEKDNQMKDKEAAGATSSSGEEVRGGGGVEEDKEEAGEARRSHNSQASNRGSTKGEDKVCLIENTTDRKLMLRLKVGAGNAHVPYTIEPTKSLEIPIKPQSTFYRLLVYAVEVAPSTKDTRLTIDSDMLRDYKHIVLSKDKDKDEYSMLKHPRT